LKDAEAKPLTDEELEKVIRELYFEYARKVLVIVHPGAL